MNMEHLYEKLEKYSAQDYYPYHMPGHKRRLYGEMPSEVMNHDITEIEGFDNLHQPQGILEELQKKAAQLYGSEESFYLVNGSTAGILAAISTAVPGNGHILMARNCHKSVYHGVYLRNLTVSYLYPPILKGYDINDAITPEQVEEALNREPAIDAVLLVSPTYEGRISDIERIAQIVHERNIPLIVDEAHGAHLGWSDHVSKNSCRQGADLVIHSVHKTLPAMTQTALLHVQGNRIDREKLKRFLHIYQSSSPSYVLMASIDNALQIMEQKGEMLLQRFSERCHAMLQKLSGCKNLKFLLPEIGKQDLGKLVINTQDTDLSGQELYDILLETYHLQMEMAAKDFCLAMFTVADEDEAYERLADALLTIDGQITQRIKNADAVSCSMAVEIPREMLEVLSLGVSAETSETVSLGVFCESQGAIALAEAWDMEWELLPMSLAINRYVGDFINLYPPGIPLLVPGERLTGDKYQYLISCLEQHLTVQGVEKIDDAYFVKVLRK